MAFGKTYSNDGSVLGSNVDTNISPTLNRRNEITGLEYQKNSVVVDGGMATTHQTGEFSKTIITSGKKYDEAFWFVYPRFKNAVLPNLAYFDVPADTTQVPNDTLLLPGSGTQGLPVTVRASGKMTYKNCGQDQGLTEYVKIYQSGILSPHSLNFESSARSHDEYLYYKGAWIMLGDGLESPRPRAFGMNKKYLFAAKTYYSGGVWRLEYYLIPRSKLDAIANGSANITKDAAGDPLFIGYDGTGAGYTEVKALAADASLDCAEYSQGDLATSSEGNTFWASQPYAFWPSPIDENVFCASNYGAPGGATPDAVKHYEVVTDALTGVTSLALKTTYTFTLPANATRGATYVFAWKQRQIDGVPAVWGSTDCGFSGHNYEYLISSNDWEQLDYHLNRHYYNSTDADGTTSTGLVYLYQILDDGSPLTVTVDRVFDSATFSTELDDLVQRQEHDISGGGWNCTTMTAYSTDTYTYTETRNYSKSWNGSNTVTATYSWGREYTLGSLTFTANHAITTNYQYTDGVVVGNATSDSKYGTASKTGETPLAIDPTNKVQIWVDWIAGVDSRRVSFASFFPNVSITNTNYESYLPLDIIEANLNIRVGDDNLPPVFEEIDQLYLVSGVPAYEWNTITYGSGGSGTAVPESGTFYYEYSDTPTVSYSHPGVPIPLLQDNGDGNPGLFGSYFCTKDYLIVTLIVGVDSLVSGHNVGVYDNSEAAVQAYRNKAFRLTRDETNAIDSVVEVDIQTEFGIPADAVFSWVFFA